MTYPLFGSLGIYICMFTDLAAASLKTPILQRTRDSFSQKSFQSKKDINGIMILSHGEQTKRGTCLEDTLRYVCVYGYINTYVSA